MIERPLAPGRVIEATAHRPLAMESQRGDRVRGAIAPRNADWLKIAPGRGWTAGLRELWEYREVLYFLTWRDVKVRYRQSVFGIGWALLQPVLLMLVFAAFVGRIIHARAALGVPYPIFALAALVPWTLFAQTLTGASESLLRDINLVSKVSFPRVIMPFAVAASYLLDFVIAMGLLIAMMLAYGVRPSGSVVWLPLFTFLAVLVALGVGILLSALNVMYRDIRAIVPFLAQVWLFASPVAYPIGIVPERWRFLYGLNPMAGVIDGFRWSLLGIGSPAAGMLAVSGVAAMILFIGSFLYFRRVDRIFADVI